MSNDKKSTAQESLGAVVSLRDGCEPEPSDLRDKAAMLYYALTNKKFDYDPCLEEILYEIRKEIDEFFGDVGAT